MTISNYDISTIRTTAQNFSWTLETLEEYIDDGTIHNDEVDIETLKSNVQNLDRFADELEHSELTYRDYRSHISTAADEIEAYIEDYADLSEAVFEAADGMYVYTSEQLQVLQVSPTEPTMEYVTGDESFAEAISTMCFEVVREDLTDELRERGHDA